MIQPAPGVAFTTASDGDCRHHPVARSRLGLPQGWATVRQKHGADVVRATNAGDQGEADAVATSLPGLPVAVFTADCLGMVLHGPQGVAAVHAGWRGVLAGVVDHAVESLGGVHSVVIGPHIRSCCFEVGPDVADQFPGHVTRTTWGTTSVDLLAAVSDRLPVPPLVVETCTHCGEDTWSHRRDGTHHRLAAVGWIP